MSGARILIVEDEMIVQMHLRQIVEGLGHEVVGAVTNPTDALVAAEANMPDLVLTDIQLAQGGDGVDTAIALRESCDCAIVFITAYSDPETLTRTAPVEAAGFLVKPFTAANVAAAVSTALTSHRRVRKAEERGRELSVLGGAEDLGPLTIPRPPFGSGTKLLVYSHDTFGLGHLRRCLKLIDTLSRRTPGLSTLLVTGSPLAHRFRLPPGSDYLKLPAVRKVAPESYEPRALSMTDGGIQTLRSNLLLRTVRDYDPDMVLVDHSPTGMNGELLPALRWVRRGSAKCILGLRDIIDDPSAVRAAWRKHGIYDLLRTVYDHVVVYGSPSVFDTANEYGLIAAGVRSGSLHELRQRRSPGGNAGSQRRQRPAPDRRNDRRRRRRGGQGRWARHRDASGSPALSSAVRVEVVLGPFADREVRDELIGSAAGLPMEFHDFVEDPTELFRRAHLVVATAGYNTAVELLTHARARDPDPAGDAPQRAADSSDPHGRARTHKLPSSRRG